MLQNCFNMYKMFLFGILLQHTILAPEIFKTYISDQYH